MERTETSSPLPTQTLAQHDQLLSILENSTDTIFVIDENGLITYLSPAVRDLMGGEPSKGVGKHFTSYIAEKDAADARATFAKALSGETIQGWQYELAKSDGSPVIVEINISPVRQNGNVRGVQGIIRDVTERNREEQRLAHFQAIVDSSHDAIVSVSPDGVVKSWNRAASQLLGYQPQEVIGRLPDFLAPPDRHTECRQIVERIRRGKGMVRLETVRLRKDGVLIDLEMTYSPIKDREGRITGASVIAHDISDRRRSERQLAEAKAQAEMANRAKSQFLANMSHEIRTPLTAILGFADLLLSCPPRDEQLRVVRTIQRNGEHLLDLINEILDLSKIEADRLEVERESCQPLQIVADVVSLMRVPAKAKNLPLDVRYPGRLPESIRTDPVRLRQILLNLLGNAIKYTETGAVRLTVRLADGQMRFEVHDTGIGIAPEQMSRLFQPFSQVNASTSRFGGTGLGLAISKRLAQLLGGDIEVQSTPGQGSQFSLVLDPGPLDQVSLREYLGEGVRGLETTPPDAPPPRLPAGCRILLAEDGPDNRRLISHILQKAGAEVVTVENGAMAVETLLPPAPDAHQPTFDVVLMDMQMPVLDGYRATRQLRSAGYLGPIIAVTAHAMKTDRTKCLDAGCDDYVAKPIDRRRLLETVCAHLGQPGIQNPSGLVK